MLVHPHKCHPSTVRLLEAGPGGASAELLRLATPRVGHNKGAIVGHEDVLDLLLRRLVDVLLVVGDDALGDGLAHRIDLSSVTAALHAEADVDLANALLAQEEQGLVDLDAKDV